MSSSQRSSPPRPRAQVEVFEGVGHLVHLEAEQRFNESVLHFLNQGR
jgi:pimeloyl-ACP methyl ester carboxylesterase